MTGDRGSGMRLVMGAAARYLAEDVVFDGPVNHTRGKEAYIEALNRFAQAVTGLKILAAFGNGTQTLILYGAMK